MKLYLKNVLEQFLKESENNESEKYILNLFLKFISCRHCFFKLEDVNETFLNEFLYVYVSGNSYVLKAFDACEITEGIYKFIDYIKETYEIEIDFVKDEKTEVLKRIISIRIEMDRFLNNPLISKSPFVIDFEKYKLRALCQEKQNEICGVWGIVGEKIKAYFAVIEMFDNNYVIVKKLYEGRFFKVKMDKGIVNLINKSDIIYMEISQNSQLSWEISSFIKYLPHQAGEYLFRGLM